MFSDNEHSNMMNKIRKQKKKLKKLHKAFPDKQLPGPFPAIFPLPQNPSSRDKPFR
jgi:hypothetical protein